jgi:hypothetical protein
MSSKKREKAKNEQRLNVVVTGTTRLEPKRSGS